LEVAVVTGGHSYDVPHFHRLFRSLEGVNAYLQSLEDFASSPEEVRDAYDALVFYFMPPGMPTDEGSPWYAGHPKTACEHLGETQQGIVILHHSILAYPDWPAWAEIVGIADRSFDYHIGETLALRVAVPDHPITAGLSDWEMVDETYEMADAGEGCRVLLETDHPKSMRSLAWTRAHGKARVFCFQPGHDNRAWVTPEFREMLRRGMLWSAGRI
jgi:hypothetical protein